VHARIIQDAQGTVRLLATRVGLEQGVRCNRDVSTCDEMCLCLIKVVAVVLFNFHHNLLVVSKKSFMYLLSVSILRL
jgi:hypothetical protein